MSRFGYLCRLSELGVQYGVPARQNPCESCYRVPIRTGGVLSRVMQIALAGDRLLAEPV